MKKKTRYTVLIAVLVLSFVLAVSCGGTPAPTPAPTREPTAAEPQTTSAPPAPTTTPTPAEPRPTPTPAAQGPIILEGAQAYTVAPGNTLSGISRHFYGDTDYFPLIMLGSSDVSDPDVIELDTKLTIPDLKRNIADPGAKAKMKSYYNEIADIYEKRSQPHYAAQLRKLADSL